MLHTKFIFPEVSVLTFAHSVVELVAFRLNVLIFLAEIIAILALLYIVPVLRIMVC